MSFQTGLSGLNAASKNLDVIGHNIANANTTGMKASRAEFGELIASSMGSASGKSAGIGVQVATVGQQFTQGSISTTGNPLDAAINGSGFFQITQTDGSAAYTRDGSFKLDKDGYLKTNTGANVMGYPTNAEGVATGRTLDKLQVPTAAPIPASQTAAVKARFNLDARAKLAATVPVTPRSTYGTSINVYDTQGVASPVQMYFQKSDNNKWDVYLGLDEPNATPPVAFTSVGTIEFDTSGKIIAPAAKLWYDANGKPVPDGDPSAVNSKDIMGLSLPVGSIPSKNPNEPSGFLTQIVTVNLGEYMPNGTTLKDSVTQFGSAFAVSDLTQDGYSAGDLTGMAISDAGLITARYSNGQTKYTGQLALADFRNAQGLMPVGGNAWAATFESGTPVQGMPGVGKFGMLRAGALEDSNVDLTAELVNMMTAQRSYQANAQTIKTQDQVIQTVVNLR